MTGPPWPTRYPGATWRPVRNTSGAMVQPIRGLIPHVQVGNGSLFTRFNDADTEVSSHLWVSKRGALEQYVDLTRRAWAQAAGNPYWISVECEGLVAEDYTPAQLARLAEIYAWGMAVYGWPAQITDDPGGRGLGAHRMGGAAWGGHSCPGDLRLGRRDDILAATRGLTGGGAAQTTGDDMPLSQADLTAIGGVIEAKLDEATGGGQPDFEATIRATLAAIQSDYNLDANTVAALKRIEAFIGSLSGNLVGPPTVGQILDALPGLAGTDLAAVVTAGVQLLASRP